MMYSPKRKGVLDWEGEGKRQASDREGPTGRRFRERSKQGGRVTQIVKRLLYLVEALLYHMEI